VEQVLEPALSDEEWAALEASAQAIRKALERVAKRPAS
jgi:hypothetical protein